MQFVHPSLSWAFFLVLVPVLIHLINMMRQRRVKWAAMEFLLHSYRRHRRWIWLKQFLLLMMRMLAIAAVVAMLAQLISPDQWSRLMGGRVTHHYILLDDSFSMSDRGPTISTFDRAKQAIRQIAERAAQRDTRQRCTLIRYSRASLAAGAVGELANDDAKTIAVEAGVNGQSDADQLVDIGAEVVTGDFADLLDDRQRQFAVSSLAVGPAPSLSLLSRLFETTDDENRIVYLVSDFRASDWNSPAELKQQLSQIEKTGAKIVLVNCVDVQRPNLAVTNVEPAAGTRAAGVPLFVNITVRNFGLQTARNVPLKVRTLFYDPRQEDIANPTSLEPDGEELPTELIEEIAAGQSITRRVQVYFPGPGQHVVEVALPPDPILADNTRHCVVNFPPNERVLIVDGDPLQENAFFLNTVFAPGNVTTGIAADTNTVEFLRDATIDDLVVYRAIYLLDVGRLGGRAVKNLETFVEQGGGLALFMGQESGAAVADYNKLLFKDGQGLLPLPLLRRESLDDDEGLSRPDIEVTEHPIFEVFRGANSNATLLGGVYIGEYIRAAEDWSIRSARAMSTLATLRNQMPLVVERSFGKGRVVVFLTTLAPKWNNWASGGPSFVVVMLHLQTYLASQQENDRPRLVGTPIELTLAANQYQADTKFVLPGPTGRRLIARTAVPTGDDKTMLVASVGNPALDHGRWDETTRPGVYEAWPLTIDSQVDLRRYAFNVDPSESDPSTVPDQQLSQILRGVKVTIHRPEDIQYELAGQSGYNWSELILYALIGLLLVEQAVAYSASYHPARYHPAQGGTR